RPVSGELLRGSLFRLASRRVLAREDATDVLMACDERRRLEVEPFDDGNVGSERFERLQGRSERQARARRDGVEAHRCGARAGLATLVTIRREEDEEVARLRRSGERASVLEEGTKQRGSRAEPGQKAAPREAVPSGDRAAHWWTLRNAVGAFANDASS